MIFLPTTTRQETRLSSSSFRHENNSWKYASLRFPDEVADRRSELSGLAGGADSSPRRISFSDPRLYDLTEWGRNSFRFRAGADEGSLRLWLRVRPRKSLSFGYSPEAAAEPHGQHRGVRVRVHSFHGMSQRYECH